MNSRRGLRLRMQELRYSRIGQVRISIDENSRDGQPAACSSATKTAVARVDSICLRYRGLARKLKAPESACDRVATRQITQARVSAQREPEPDRQLP